jgi:hypothetical protein
LPNNTNTKTLEKTQPTKAGHALKKKDARVHYAVLKQQTHQKNQTPTPTNKSQQPDPSGPNSAPDTPTNQPPPIPHPPPNNSSKQY